MKLSPTFARVVLGGSMLVVAASAGAQTVQLAPFAGWQFGGSVLSPVLERSYSFKSGLVWGGTVDFATSEDWRVELFYSRQQTALHDSTGLELQYDVNVERYLLGIQQETGEGSVRYFGTLLLGATRFVPGVGSGDSDTRFTAGVGLGVKSLFSKHVGLRLEVRGFYTVVEKDGGVFCSNGTCLFAYSGSGIWQGDATGGLIFIF
jgi:hypothetical protein